MMLRPREDADATPRSREVVPEVVPGADCSPVVAAVLKLGGWDSNPQPFG